MKTWIEAHHSGGKKKINIQTKAGKEIYCHPLETTTQMNQTKKKKKQSSLKKMGQVIDISLKEIYKWPIRTSKDAQHH